jgi:adenine-specific DNA-methyltransferase
MNKLELISKIKQLEGISQDERAYLVELVNTKKKYGLVWEDKPEEVEEQLRENLPVLKEIEEKAIINGEEHPNHILIEGDNLHALTSLTFTHESKVDLIYIDPPYNTGNNDFRYNDTFKDEFIDKENPFRHSTWLSFMNRRLKIAKKLLSEKGVIFISIDDNEQAQLKLLCDEIFGENNIVAQMIWQQGKKSSGNLLGINHEYMFVYAKNRSLIDSPELAWKQRKDGLEKIYKKYENLKKAHKNDYLKIEQEIKLWFNSLAENDPAFASKHYSLVDKKGLFFADNSCAPDKPETRCHKPLIHPITNKETVVPSLGWRWKEATLDKMVSDEKIYFGKDENTVPKVKKYLKEMETELPSSVFYKDGRGASSELDLLLGEKKFNNPKDRYEIARILNLRYNGVILDFFAGSGTTLHSTMALNAEDGGNRQCILVTNNENNICEEVTYERNKRVIEGYTNSKGLDVESLSNNNLRYFKSTFVPSTKTEQNKRLLTQASTELICIKEDCYYNITKENGFESSLCSIFTNKNGKYLIIVYHSRAILNVCKQLIKYIEQLETTEKIKLYAFSPEKETLVEDFIDVQDKIDAVPLPEAIYNAYRATFRVLKLDKKPKSSPSKIETEDENSLFDNLIQE